MTSVASWRHDRIELVKLSKRDERTDYRSVNTSKAGHIGPAGELKL